MDSGKSNIPEATDRKSVKYVLRNGIKVFLSLRLSKAWMFPSYSKTSEKTNRSHSWERCMWDIWILQILPKTPQRQLPLMLYTLLTYCRLCLMIQTSLHDISPWNKAQTPKIPKLLQAVRFCYCNLQQQLLYIQEEKAKGIRCQNICFLNISPPLWQQKIPAPLPLSWQAHLHVKNSSQSAMIHLWQ